jgi:hypothetical protein
MRYLNNAAKLCKQPHSLQRFSGQLAQIHGIVDASSHGVGGVVVGELSELPPAVFQLQWPPKITNALVTFENLQGKINNLDLEMAGLLLLWLCIEGIAQTLEHKHVALFIDNTPTIGWVERMVSQKFCIAAQLVRVLALRHSIAKMCLITPVHIPGVKNPMADIPSRKFGSNPEWYCCNDDKLLTLLV